MITYEERIKQIISKIIEQEDICEKIFQGIDFRESGMKSLEFMKLIVTIENEFDMEFMEADIETASIQNFDTLIQCVKKYKEEKGEKSNE